MRIDSIIKVAVIVSIFFFTACSSKIDFFENHKLPENTGSNIFNFIMPQKYEDLIVGSSGKKIDFSAAMFLYFEDDIYFVESMRLRGQAALNFPRKSYSLFVSPGIEMAKDNKSKGNFEKFKLISMSHDFTYIENRFGHIVLNEMGLWPLHSSYTEVIINDRHNGLYLFIEDPENYLFGIKNAQTVIRRSYKGQISKIELNSTESTNNIKHYTAKYKQIYKTITEHTGDRLYAELCEMMNIDMYMRKMAVDMILSNGDTADEVFFYAVEKNNKTYFEILPWDYDDLFESSPHEAGRAWAVGKRFGKRVYNNADDVKKELDGRLIFSVEDDIDYIVAMDTFLYNKYLRQLDFVVSILDVQYIELIFEQLRDELNPYYAKNKVIEQSKYDENPTSPEIFLLNIENKKKYLQDRLVWIKKELENNMHQ
jgi:hypothetical protein